MMRNSLTYLIIAAVALGGLSVILRHSPKTDAASAAEGALGTAEDSVPYDDLRANRLPEDPSRDAQLGPGNASDEELARARWVEGRVVFPAETPSDEVVWVVARGWDFEHRPLHRVRVDRDGRFRVAFQERTRTLHFHLEARYLYLEPKAKIARSEIPQEVVLRPKVGGRLHGSVLVPDSTRAAVVGARVDLVNRGRRGEPRFFHRIKLDDSLTYTFDAVPPGADYSLCLADFPLVDTRVDDLRIRPGAMTSVDLSPTSGATIAGVVRDENGAAVPDAYVGIEFDLRLGRKRGTPRRAPAAVTTDSGGAFEITGIPAGYVLLRVEHDDYLVASHTVGRLGDGDVKTDIAVTLDAGNVITGKVLWPGGAPAVAARVEFRGLEEEEREEDARPIRTDSEGRFRIAGLGEGPFLVHATAVPEVEGDRRHETRRSAWRARQPDVAPGAQIGLTLSPGLEFIGQVLDSSGAPIPRFYVRAEPAFEDIEQRFFAADQILVQSFRSEDGRFTLNGLKVGEWLITARARGFESSEPQTISMPRGELVITLKPEADGADAELSSE